MIANTESHEPKSSQEVFKPVSVPVSCAITPHQVVDGFDAACISARQCVYLMHHRLRLCLGVGG